MALAEHSPADFSSTFRQRFAALFGRKIARQRSEQYLGALLGGGADRRNVTSLARTVDGATARSLGWLLNKSPWPTRPVVEALQAYVGETIGAPDGVFVLSIDSFAKRGDNAVGAEKQYVAHLGKTQICQLGVFLTYGTERGSALVDAELYLPPAWTESPARRQRAGVPEDVQYQPPSALATELLRRIRVANRLPGRWVTSWHGDGFDRDLRDRLDAEGWWYLLPAPPETLVSPEREGDAPCRAADLVGDATTATTPRRVWAADGEGPGRPVWLLVSPDEQTGAPVVYLSNAPEGVSLKTLKQVVARRSRVVQMLAASSERVSLDVYRVRGWDGWHRHVTLALLASAFRACLPVGQGAVTAEVAEPPTSESVMTEAPMTELSMPEPALAESSVPSEPEPLTVTAAAPEPAAAAGAPADASAEVAAACTPVAEPVVEPAPAALPAVAALTTYHVQVELADTDWRAVRAFQVLLAAEECGEILFSMPTRADIERQDVGAWMEVRVRGSASVDDLRRALSEVPEITVVQLGAADAPVVDAPVVDAPVVEEPASSDAPAPADAFVADHVDAAEDPEDQLALLAALEAELSVRTAAREAGLTALDLAADAVAATVFDVTEMTKQDGASHELIVASAHAHASTNGSTNGSAHGTTNGTTNGSAHGTLNGGAELANGSLVTPVAPPRVPPAEAPAYPVPPAPAPGPAEPSGAASSGAASNGAASSGAPSSGMASAEAAKPVPAEQPAEADARADEQQMVILDVGEESYGVPVQRVREIVRVPPITRVPNGPAFLEGVINLRGQVIPVMDLRKHLGIPSGEHTRRSRVIVSELGRHTVGLIVDGVSQVVMVATSDIEPPPTLIAGANDGQVRGVARLGERLVLFLDPDRVLPNR